MHQPPPSPHRFQPRRAVAGVILGWAVMTAGYAAGLLAAYQLAQGSIAGFDGPVGASYLADDLHAVLRRSLATYLVALPIWGLVHYYGRRGPLIAAAYALGVGWIGFQAFERDAGPIGLVAQYLAYAPAALVSLLLTWRLAYRRVAPPTARIYAFRSAA